MNGRNSIIAILVIILLSFASISFAATQCFRADDFYSVALTGLSKVEMGPVTITEATLPPASGGTDVPLNLEVNGAGTMDIQVPWSESTAAPPAKINIDKLCSGGYPQLVRVDLRHYNYVNLSAYNDSGTLVGTISASSTKNVSQTLTLTSSSGIKTIDIDGSELYIERVCIICESGQTSDGDCVYPDEYFFSELSDLEEVTMALVTIHEATLPVESGGADVPLAIVENTNTGKLEVSVPWSESTADPAAVIEMGDGLCALGNPKSVSVTLRHTNYCNLTAFNAKGAQVDSVSASSNKNIPQTLTLTAASGIERIRIDGSEIYITQICWSCIANNDNPDSGDADGEYSYYLPYFTSQSNYWTGLGLTNCAESQANIDVTVYSQNGNSMLTDSKTAAAAGQEAWVLETTSIPGRQGWMQVDSDKPLAGVCFFGTELPDNYMADVPFVNDLSTTLIVPHVAQYEYWDTSIMVCNPNDSPTQVTLTYTDSTGTASTPVTKALPAMGSGRYELSDLLGETEAMQGYVKIEADHGVAAFALYNNLKNGGYCYAGILAVDPTARTENQQDEADNGGDSPF